MPEQAPERDDLEEDVTVEDLDDTSEAPFRYSITSYGADYPVDSIVKRVVSGAIFIPSFQRDYVWTLPQASRFVESLLLGLPVPGVFLSKEPESEKLLVIDGQQRLRSLEFYYSGLFGDRKFGLKDVQERFEGRTYTSLEAEDRRRLDDAIIHATVIRQDEPSEDASSVYHIFERLNTGGTALTPQEIRACLYHGELNALLGILNDDPAWRSIYGKKNARMKDQELILRFFAMRFFEDEYERPMKSFLNRYMAHNRALETQTREILERTFHEVVGVINASLGPAAVRPVKALNAAVLDAVMVGISSRLERGPISDATALKSAVAQLLADPEFGEAYTRATADEESVHTRLRIAREMFAAVP